METKRKPLLSTNNVKTMKGTKLGYMTYIMYLSPFSFNTKGINVCSHASKGCAEACLVSSGFGGRYVTVIEGRKKRTEYFLSSRVEFMYQLKTEIEKAIKKHEGKAIVTFRLNGTSDLPFEKYKVFEGKNMFEIFENVQFYDYTKNYLRFDKELPKNYHLTFSRSETNHTKAIDLLNRGFNVAMVFDKTPTSYLGFEVVNGDETDLRFLDKKNVIVGLKYKKMTGKGANNNLAFESGFAIKLKNRPTLTEIKGVYDRILLNSRTLHTEELLGVKERVLTNTKELSF
jgi:hypothetical protein